MGAFDNLLSGLIKKTVDTITDTVKDKIEDIMDGNPEQEADVNITIETLYNRLGGVPTPLTGEEFIERMQSIGCEAKLISMDNIPGIPAGRPTNIDDVKLYSARKDGFSFSATFKVYDNEEAAIRGYDGQARVYRTEAGRRILSEEDGRIFHHNTLNTGNTVQKTYILHSRIENTLLTVLISEDKADALAADLVKALRNTGY